MRQKRLSGGPATRVQHFDGQEFQFVCYLGSIRQHMYAIKSKSREDKGNREGIPHTQPIP